MGAADISDVAEAVAAYRAARHEAFSGLMPREAVLPRTYHQDVERWLGFAVDPNGRLFIARVSLKVAGLAALEFTDGQAELGALYVHPGCQRSGAGASLLSAVLGAARAAGRAEVIGWVLAANQPAKRFFLSCGGWLDGGVGIREVGPARLTMQRIRFNAEHPRGRER